MEPDLRAAIFSNGGKIIGQAIRLIFSRPRPRSSVESESAVATVEAPKEVPALVEKEPTIPLPTKAETTQELKRRLGRELYKAELDLAAGLLIAGKPCSCLESKHTLRLEAAAEELIAEEPANTVYLEVIQWIKDNGHKVSVPAIASRKYASEYPRMASEFKDFRKRVMGTVAVSDIQKPPKSLTLDQAKKIAAAEAAREVEKRWDSLKMK
jgi:hypothetical protein